MICRHLVGTLCFPGPSQTGHNVAQDQDVDQRSASLIEPEPEVVRALPVRRSGPVVLRRLPRPGTARPLPSAGPERCACEDAAGVAD